MKISQPTPEKIKAAREAAGLSRKEAAALVHAYDDDGGGSYRTWQNWELGIRPMPLAQWELFLIKTEKSRRERRGKA